MMDEAVTLVVGLGNPGRQYENTRHNVGFMAVDGFVAANGLSWKNEAKFVAHLAIGKASGGRLLVAKPTTYMNLSGDAVGKLMRYYHVPLERLLVVYDDVALPFGKIRFRPEGSAGSHNGMKSLIGALGGQQFPRLRIGVSGAPAGWDLKDYVLAPFTQEEQRHLPDILTGCREAMEYWLAHGTQKAMNAFNSKLLVPPPPVAEEVPVQNHSAPPDMPSGEFFS